MLTAAVSSKSRAMRPKPKLKGAAAVEKSQKTKEVKVKGKVTTTNRKSRASTSKPISHNSGAKHSKTKAELIVCKMTGQTRLPLVA